MRLASSRSSNADLICEGGVRRTGGSRRLPWRQPWRQPWRRSAREPQHGGARLTFLMATLRPVLVSSADLHRGATGAEAGRARRVSKRRSQADRRAGSIRAASQRSGSGQRPQRQPKLVVALPLLRWHPAGKATRRGPAPARVGSARGGRPGDAGPAGNRRRERPDGLRGSLAARLGAGRRRAAGQVLTRQRHTRHGRSAPREGRGGEQRREGAGAAQEERPRCRA